MAISSFNVIILLVRRINKIVLYPICLSTTFFLIFAIFTIFYYDFSAFSEKFYKIFLFLKNALSMKYFNAFLQYCRQRKSTRTEPIFEKLSLSFSKIGSVLIDFRWFCSCTLGLLLFFICLPYWRF